MNKVLSFVLLLSGLSGISYEILYGRILGSMLGDQFAVSASVLITFLFGIGAGAKYAHRFWGKLWLIEGAIGVYGIFFALARNAIDFVLYHGLSFLPPLFGSVLLGSLLLVPPAFLIGCSVPLFAGYLSRIEEGPAFSRAYSIYNFGAALTALFIEFWLIRVFGITGTVLSFGFLNLLSAAILYFAGKSVARNSPAIEPLKQLPRTETASLVLASIASAVFQLFMVKVSELMFGPFRETFAIVLSIVLFGIALGSYLSKHFRLRYDWLLALNLLGLLFFLAAFKEMLYLYASLYPAMQGAGIPVLKGVVIFLLMGIPALSFGATVPALVRAHKEVSAESGNLLFISSLANAAGFLLMALVLHRYLDYGAQLLAVSFTVAAALVLYSRRAVILAVAIVAATVAIERGKWDENLLYLSYTSFQSAAAMEKDRKEFNFPDKFKGYQDVFSINWMNGAPFFFINGYISFPMNNPSEKVVGTLGPMFSPKTDNALVLGLGSGTTASAVGQLFAHTDVVEINPVVRENQYRMKEWNFDIEHNPKVNIVVDDAIHYSKAGDKKYDMILNTVTSPLYFSSSKLYTRDFFEAIKKRLNPGGTYLTWMDVRVGPRGAEIILKSLQQSFRYCAMLYIKSGYFLLVASDQPVRLHHPDIAAGTPLERDLMNKHGLLPRLFPYNLLTGDAYALVKNSSAPRNTIDHPELEFEMARLREENFGEFRNRVVNGLDFSALRPVIEPAMKFDPVLLVAEAKKVIGTSAIAKKWEREGRINIFNFDARLDEAELGIYRQMAETANEPETHQRLGDQYRNRQRYFDAIEEYRKVLALDPNHPGTWFDIGLCYEYGGRYQDAVDAYRQAGRQDPKNPEVPYQIAGLFMLDGQYERALGYVEEALAMKKLAKFFQQKGNILSVMGRNEDAVAAWNQALALEPDNRDVQLSLNRYLGKY